MNTPNPDRPCLTCGKPLRRRINESSTHFKRRRYCDNECYTGSLSMPPSKRRFNPQPKATIEPHPCICGCGHMVPILPNDTRPIYAARKYFHRSHLIVQRRVERREIVPKEKFRAGFTRMTDVASKHDIKRVRGELAEKKEHVGEENGVPIYRVPRGVGGCPL